MKPARFAAMILSVLLLYVLSPGPLNKWYSRHPDTEEPKAVIVFYVPLRWLYEHNSAVHAAYDWYFMAMGS